MCVGGGGGGGGGVARLLASTWIPLLAFICRHGGRHSHTIFGNTGSYRFYLEQSLKLVRFIAGSPLNVFPSRPTQKRERWADEISETPLGLIVSVCQARRICMQVGNIQVIVCIDSTSVK